jgi:putative addiction module component (TIGR02574 family)
MEKGVARRLSHMYSLDRKTTMARTLTHDEIFELPVQERLRLIETLWDSIDPRQLAVPESHLRVLDDAMREYESDPAEGRSWDEVRDELFPKR